MAMADLGTPMAFRIRPCLPAVLLSRDVWGCHFVQAGEEATQADGKYATAERERDQDGADEAYGGHDAVSC